MRTTVYNNYYNNTNTNILLINNVTKAILFNFCCHLFLHTKRKNWRKRAFRFKPVEHHYNVGVKRDNFSSRFASRNF